MLDKDKTIDGSLLSELKKIKPIVIAFREKYRSTHKEKNIYLETQYMQCLRLHPAMPKIKKTERVVILRKME